MMKKKKIWIVVIVAMVVLVAAGIFFVPRVVLYQALQQTEMEITATAQYFTEYDIKNDELVTIETDNFYIDIPADFVPGDTIETAIMYELPDEGLYVAWIKENEPVDMNLLNPEIYEDKENNPYGIRVKNVKKGFEALGYGTPDSFYNTSKCAMLLQEDDYSFWNLNEMVAYYYALLIKNETMWGAERYIYETDDKYAFINVMYDEDNGKCRCIAEFLRPDDLQTPYSVLIWAEDRETAFAIVNSVEFK